MRRRSFDTIADDDTMPVIVPRNVKALVPVTPERVRRLRRHLLRVLRTVVSMERTVSPVLPEPEGYAARVARTACALCEGSCCANGADTGFLDERTIARVSAARPNLGARDLMRLYIARVPDAAYRDSCIFHGKRGCSLDRSSRSDVCNSYFCGGLENYMASDATETPVTVIAGDSGNMRISPALFPREGK